jgi:hypothetical protein
VLTVSLAIALVVALLALARSALAVRRLRETVPPVSPVERFREQLGRELLRADRTGRPACLAVVALAGGQQFDAERRRELAGVIDRCARTIDSAHEIAHDEIAIVLAETRAHGALRAGDRIREALIEAGCAQPRVGIAEAGPGIDVLELFRHAYCALLAAGVDGRPPVLAYALELDPELHAPVHVRTVL